MDGWYINLNNCRLGLDIDLGLFLPGPDPGLGPGMQHPIP